MLHFSLSAPDVFDDVARRVWFAALESFKLESPRGMTVAMQPSAEATPAAPAAASAYPAGNGEAENTFATHALAGNAESFDPDHPLNARLRNNGEGFVPNLIAQDDESRSGTFAAGAIMAAITVPFGWHIIDDSRRTLVFETEGETQISLNLIRHQGRDAGAVLDEIEAATRRDYSAPEFVRGEYAGFAILGVRNISHGSQPIEQYHMLRPAPRGEAFVRARVTTVAQKRAAAGNLAELILLSVQPLPAANEEPPDDRAWVRELQELEAQDRVEEAEQLIRREVDHIGCAVSIAEMYRRRMRRLLAAGDRAAAAKAFESASDWMGTYASWATSGGEGTANSRERDEFRRELIAEFGSDPTA